jgi:hypothetical protein
MSLNNPYSGFNNALEYQVAATPYMTSSIATQGVATYFSFPNVTKSITILNRSAAASGTLSFGVTKDGLVSNKCILNAGETFSANIRTKDLWIKGETSSPPYSLCAGLTGVSKNMMSSIDFNIGTSPFNPNALSPQVWLRSDLGITLATGVSVWADQSGNGNNVVQATTAKQPILSSSFYGNIPAISWGIPDGNAKKLISANNFILANGDFEWYVISYMSTAEAASIPTRAPYMLMSSDGTVNYQIFNHASLGIVGTIGNAGGVITSGYPVNIPLLTSIRRSGVSCVGVRNAILTSISDGVYMATSQKLCIGGLVTADIASHVGSIFEVITFNRYLSTLERTSLLSYLSARYGQSWTT